MSPVKIFPTRLSRSCNECGMTEKNVICFDESHSQTWYCHNTFTFHIPVIIIDPTSFSNLTHSPTDCFCMEMTCACVLVTVEGFNTSDPYSDLLISLSSCCVLLERDLDLFAGALGLVNFFCDWLLLFSWKWDQNKTEIELEIVQGMWNFRKSEKTVYLHILYNFKTIFFQH